MVDLFLKGLEFLRKQFEKRADAELCCYLFEYPVIGDAPSGLPWGDKRPEAFKWELGTFYRNFRFAEGTPRVVDSGAKREIYFFGPEKLRNEFLRLAGEAGKLVSTAPNIAFPIAIPDGTLQAQHDQLRWCYVLFDLAWARIKGTPLRATEKFAWNGDVLLPLEELPKLRQWNGYEWGRDISERAARIPDPPSWFSNIDDLWRASVYAVDVLLAAVASGGREAETELSPTAKPDADRFDWISAATALAIAQLGADLFEQLSRQPDDDAMAFMVRQSAAQTAWELERLVNVNRFPADDRRRGRYGRPGTIVVGIWKLCERLTTLYDFLGWQEVCVDAGGPDVAPLSGHKHRPWWLRRNGFRPPNVPKAMNDGLRSAVAELARAAQYAYSGEIAPTFAGLLGRLGLVGRRALDETKEPMPAEPSRTIADPQSLAFVSQETLQASERPIDACLVAPKPFQGGMMVFFPDRVELCGVDICSGPRSRPMRKVLELLGEMRRDGTFVGYSGNELAEKTDRKGGQNSAGGLIRDLRNRISEVLLKEANIACGPSDVIVSGGPGYRLNESISVQDIDVRDGKQMMNAHDPANESNDPNVRGPGDPNDPNDAVAVRRTWILDQLAKGRQLRAPDVVKDKKCSLKTARRDLKALEVKIEFFGPSRTGYYRLRETTQPS